MALRCGLLLALPVSLMLGWSCQETASPNRFERQEVAAQTAAVELQKVLLTRSFPGQVEAKNEILLSSKLAGFVLSVSAQEGERVHAGQRLVAMDEAELRRKLDNFSATRDQVSRQRAALQAQAATAKSHHERYRELYAAGMLSKEENEQAQSQYDALTQQIAALEAQDRAVEAQSAEVKTQFAYTLMLSPVDGVITKKYVSAGSSVNPGQPLLAVEEDGQSGGFWFVADVDEVFLRSATTGQELLLSIGALNREITAPLSYVVPQVDPTTRTFRVKLDLTDPAVKSGMYGHLYWPLGDTERTVIPAAALILRGELTAVYTVDKERLIHFRLLKTGQYLRRTRDGAYVPAETPPDPATAVQQKLAVEVLSGLHPGEIIVTSNLGAVSEGMVVKHE